MGLQHSSQEGHGEGGVVDVGIAGDEDDIHLIPATRPHLRPRDGQKFRRTPVPMGGQGHPWSRVFGSRPGTLFLRQHVFS